jgi:hypothetical protein
VATLLRHGYGTAPATTVRYGGNWNDRSRGVRPELVEHLARARHRRPALHGAAARGDTGTLQGAPLELRGADRYTLRGGKATEGHAYFDPRPFLDAQAAPTDP